jgi:hypothetical protein
LGPFCRSSDQSSISVSLEMIEISTF